MAAVVESLRPEWAARDIARAINADDRPWRIVVLASIRGAAGSEVRHPNGLRYVNPDGTSVGNLPPTITELRTAERCVEHQAIKGACALCRRGIGATE